MADIQYSSDSTVMNWQRVKSMDEVNIGDIVRINPEYSGGEIIVIKKILCDFRRRYSIVIYYDKTIIIKNNKIDKIIYEDSFSESYKTFTKDLLFSQYDSNSWAEKLIIEEEKEIKIKDSKDEIDLLMDCIFN